MNSFQQSHSLSSLSSHDWCHQAPPFCPKPLQTLRVATFNLHGFLHHRANSLHDESSLFVSQMVQDGNFDFLGLQEMGLNLSSVSVVSNIFHKHQLHLIMGSAAPTYSTCGLLITRWWFAHHTHVWCHPTGRALCVTFQVRKGVRLFVCSIYGISGGSCHEHLESQTMSILDDLTVHLRSEFTPLDDIIVVGDFNLPRTSSPLETWGHGLDIVNVLECWRQNSGHTEFNYLSFFPFSSPLSAGTCIDHIWCSAGLSVSVSYVGATSHGFLSSDHAVVISDFHTAFLGGSSNVLYRHLHPVSVPAVFPRAKGWSELQWECWTLSMKLVEWQSLTTHLQAIPQVFIDDYAQCHNVRAGYDQLWKELSESISRVYPNRHSSVSSFPSLPNPFCSRLWKEAGWTQQLIGHLRVLVEPTCILSEAQKLEIVNSFAERSSLDLGTVNLQDFSQWPFAITKLYARLAVIRRTIGKQRAFEKRACIERAIQRRTSAFITGRSRPLYQSFKQKMSAAALARPAGLWSITHNGLPRLLSKPQDILESSLAVFSGQTAFSPSPWGVLNIDAECLLINELLSARTSASTFANITDRLPLGLQPFYCRPLPSASFSSLLPEWTVAELKGCLRKHAPWKAAGPSGAQTAHLRQLPDEALGFLVELYNHIQCTGIWPSKWKHAFIFPIPKSDGSPHLEKMRPISLVETFVKIFTRRTLSCLVPVFSSADYIHPMQYGFTGGQSSSDPVYIVRMVYEALQIHPGDAIVNYIDIKNAYNAVPHWGLVYTLLSSGLPIQYVRLLMDLDIGATAQVLTPVGLTASFQLHAGVRQGEVLSPWKFLMWINPLAGWLHHQIQPDIPRLLCASWWPEFKEYQKCSCPTFPRCKAEHQQSLRTLLMALPLGISLDNMNIVGLLFADDIWVIHKNRLGAQVQVWKISTFVRGWGPQVQSLKSACSSILPSKNSQLCFVDLPDLSSTYTALPYLTPSTAYKYLGVPLCTNLVDTQSHHLLQTRLSQILNTISKLRISVTECSALYMSMVTGVFRYFLKGVGVSWTQLARWDTMSARVFREKFSARKTSLTAPFWLPNCWFARPPTSLTKLACQVWIQTVHHASNSAALLGQLFRKQLVWLAHTPGHLPRDTSTPWDRGPMQHFYVDYALAALVRLGWSLDSSEQLSLVQRRFPSDFPITRLIDRDVKRPNFRLATMCAKHGVFYVSQVCDSTGERLSRFQDLGWECGDRVLYNSLKQILVPTSDSETLQLLEQWVVSPLTGTTHSLAWSYIEPVQVKWSLMPLAHNPVFAQEMLSDIYQCGFYVTDGSASSSHGTTSARSGAAAFFVSADLQVWQAAISFCIPTSSFLTELAALTVAIQHSEGLPRFIFSDCQSALQVLWTWSSVTIGKLETSNHPVAEWILKHLHHYNALLVKHAWPLWWLKGHTGRPDWLFPLQQCTDSLAGSLPLLQLHRRHMWVTARRFVVRNHNGILDSLSSQSIGHRFDDVEFSAMLHDHPLKSQWVTDLSWPSACHKWRSKWINGIIPGPILWPFIFAREEGLPFLTRDFIGTPSKELHGCQWCQTSHIDEPIAFLSCPMGQKNLHHLHASFLSLYLKASPLAWGITSKRWQPQSVRAGFINQTPMVLRRICSSRGQYHHDAFLATLPVSDLCGPIAEVVASTRTRTTPKKMLIHEVESFVWQCPTTNRQCSMHQYRFLDLWQRFLEHANQTDCTMNSRVSFLAALSEMIARETAESDAERTCIARWDQSWATPDTLYAIIHDLGAEVEWFGSPLNYSFLFKVHFSASAKDSIWGFEFDAYHDHSTEPPLPRNWADRTFLKTSPVTQTMMQVHFSVANPPYLHDDLLQLCIYAARACTSQVPVRIWCILPASCKTVPNMSIHIHKHGGHIIATWPAFAFSFVPLDFWLGLQVFSSQRGHTAPMQIMLVVFENDLASKFFPITHSNILLLQTWTRYALGPKSKLTKWDLPVSCSGTFPPNFDALSWWDDAILVRPLLDLLIPHQWWVEPCTAPFDGISPWVGAWGVPPPALYDWLVFCGCSHYQVASFVSDWERRGIENMTQLWLCRSSALSSKACSSLPAASLPTCPIQAMSVGPKPTQTNFRSCKRSLDAFTFGSTPTMAHQLGDRSFNTVVATPFHALIRAPARWKHLFAWLRPQFSLSCPQCLNSAACMRADGIFCSVCRLSHYHAVSFSCVSLHCVFCSTPSSPSWWSVALFHPICNTCFTELSYVLPAHATASCPVPLCTAKPYTSAENTQSLDGSGFCKVHLKRQPNLRQFSMLRLRYLLQSLNRHSALQDNSYHEATMHPLWMLARLSSDGGITNCNVPYEPWQLDTLLLKLSPLTADASLAIWKTCPDVGVRPASGV